MNFLVPFLILIIRGTVKNFACQREGFPTSQVDRCSFPGEQPLKAGVGLQRNQLKID